MTNNKIFEAIDQLQYVLDKHAKSGVYQFANQEDIKLLEKVYNHITKRQYIKFNAGCSSCIKESFLILQNWSKRELKKMEAEANTEVELTVESVEEVLTEPEVSAEDLALFNAEIADKLDDVITSMKEAEEVKEEVKTIQKSKTNGRKRK